jgi:hypothetical protein
MTLINNFDFEIKHIKGKENKVADTLSQSMQTIHLATTSVGEYSIQENIKNLSRGDGFFN